MRHQAPRHAHAQARPEATSLRSRALLVAPVVCAVAAVTAVGLVSGQRGGATEPTSAGTGSAPVVEQVRTDMSPTPAAVGPVLPRSVPVKLRIHAIDVRTRLVQLGLNPDGTIEVPPPDRADAAGWYRYSPTPGEVGPAVILGTVTGESGPGVFHRLDRLERGDRVRVVRADEQVAVFRVDRVRSYPKDRFPTEDVYGATRRAALRLITWSGQASDADNVVVYAHLVFSRTLSVPRHATAR